MIMSQETSTPAIVAPQVLLNNHLKALKLPTFAREYDMLHPKMIMLLSPTGIPRWLPEIGRATAPDRTEGAD
jgi:hypothetical protein